MSGYDLGQDVSRLSNAHCLRESKTVFLEFEDFKPEEYSICRDCAKHPSIKRFIADHPMIGAPCGVCLRDPRVSIYEVADTSEFEKLSNLIRALIRFYYDEYQYNPHWGGDETPSSLLQNENPILFHEYTEEFHRVADENESFFEWLFDPPYPPYDEGVAVYAGFYDGVRTLNWSLKQGISHKFREFRKRTYHENHFSLEPDLMKVFDQIGDRISGIVEKHTTFFRARIGIDHKVTKFGTGFVPQRLSIPFSGIQLSAPPAIKASAGRLNRTGVSFLYLASNEETAVAEIRPHPSHEVSVGQFRSQKALKTAKFDIDIYDFASSDEQLDLYEFIIAANKAMSQPVTPEAASRYSITQLLAEVARQRGYDGVEFASSIGTGRNLCIFDASSFEYIENSAKVQRVVSLEYKLDPVDMISKSGAEADDFTYPD